MTTDKKIRRGITSRQKRLSMITKARKKVFGRSGMATVKDKERVRIKRASKTGGGSHGTKRDS